METKVTHFTPPAQYGRYASAIGAIIVCVSAFLSWGTVDGMTVRGIDGDGKLTFAIALTALILLLIKRISLWVVIILGVIIEIIGIIQNITMNDKIAELESIFASSVTSSGITGNVGLGVYLTIVGAALIIFGSLFQWIKNRKK